MFGEILTFDIPSASVTSISSSTGRPVKTVTKTTVDIGAKGEKVDTTTDNTIEQSFRSGRLSWRQINNYQDLKNAQ